MLNHSRNPRAIKALGEFLTRPLGNCRRHGVTFTPEAHWKLAMMLRRQAIAAPDDVSRQELEPLARIALLCARMAAQQQRKNT
jgi:hypothetical protein